MYSLTVVTILAKDGESLGDRSVSVSAETAREVAALTYDTSLTAMLDLLVGPFVTEEYREGMSPHDEPVVET